jgi:hypothetical protein
MKKGIILSFVSGFLLLLLCFTAEAADTLRIHLTYKHRLNEAGQTLGYKTISQQFYTPDGQFFREINYDESSGQMKNYIFLFYKNDKLYTEECYNAKDSLLYIVKHEYNPNGDETIVTRMVPNRDGLVQAERKTSVFNRNSWMVSSKKVIGKKTGTITKYTYDANGVLLLEKIVNKPVAKAPFKHEIREYSYQDGRINKVTTKGIGNSKPYQYIEEFSYNAAGLPSTIKRTGTDASVIMEKSYKYLKSGSLSAYQEFDASGKMTMMLQYDYKKHYMDKGNQVSYYENL